MQQGIENHEQPLLPGLTAPHCASLRLTAPHCASLRLTAPHCASLRLTAPHCASLRLTAPHCASLLIGFGSLLIGFGFVALSAPHAKADWYTNGALPNLNIGAHSLDVDSLPTPGPFPPQDHNGTPARSTVQTALNWQWRGDEPKVPLEWAMLSFTVTGTNKARHTGGNEAWAAATTIFSIANATDNVDAYSSGIEGEKIANAPTGTLSVDIAVGSAPDQQPNGGRDPQMEQAQERNYSSFSSTLASQAYGSQRSAGYGEIHANCGDASITSISVAGGAIAEDGGVGDGDGGGLILIGG